LAIFTHASFINLLKQATCLSWRTAIIFTRYSTTSFIGHFFILMSNQSWISYIGVLPSGSPAVYYMLNTQLFFTKRHCIFYYINDSQLLLRTKRTLQEKQMWLNHSPTEGYYRDRKGGKRRGFTKRHYTCYYNRAGEMKKFTSLRLPSARPSLR
jgi:hypothetical protein